MHIVRGLGCAIAAIALALAATASQAVLIGSGSNNPYAFSWSYNTGTSLLTGFGSMTISGFNSSVLSVTISLTNTSALGGAAGERLTAFGFGIDPSATSVGFVDAADGGMIAATPGASFPGVASIEVCAFGGANCASGSGGIFAGTSDTFSIVLGGIWGSSVNVDPIAFSYQTGYGSFQFPSSSSGSSSGSSSSGSSGGVPEPASTALVGTGLLLLASSFVFRRRTAATRCSR